MSDTDSKSFMQFSGLLVTFGGFNLVDGFRTYVEGAVQAGKYGSDPDSHGFSPATITVSGTLYAAYALLGFLIGCCSFFLGLNHAMITRLVYTISCIFALFAAIIFILARPIWGEEEAGGNVAGIDKEDSETFTAFTIFGRLAISVAVQGGFLAMLNLVRRVQAGESHLLTVNVMNRYMMLFSGMQLLFGLAQMLFTAQADEVYDGSNRLDSPVAIFPHVVVWTSVALLTGLVCILNGAFGVLLSCRKGMNSPIIFALTSLLCMALVGLTVIFLTLGDLGAVDPTGPVVNLTISLYILPIFFHAKVCEINRANVESLADVDHGAMSKTVDSQADNSA